MQEHETDFRTIGNCRLELVLGNIIDQQVDAIVNAANSQLAGGGGVDGAIHDAGGPAIMQETREKYPAGCPTGSAVPSTAGSLPAKYVFHAVGPVYHDGRSGEHRLLASAYATCLELAIEHQCQSVAFPAISTGVYGYPQRAAAHVALNAVIEFLTANQAPALVRFVLFDKASLDIVRRALADL